LLLNVGPTADGRIPVIMQERLLDIGDWLNVNGDAIYGTRKYAVSSVKSDNQALYFSSKENEIYCFYTKWTDTIEINLPLKEKVRNVTLLGYKGNITWAIDKNNKLIVDIPRLTIDEIPCQYAWTLKIILNE
jgi:alpha-L-fucosidase